MRILISLLYVCNRQQSDFFCINIPGSGQCPHNEKRSNIIGRNIHWFLPSVHSIFEMDTTNTPRCYGHEQGLTSDKHHPQDNVVMTRVYLQTDSTNTQDPVVMNRVYL